MAHENVEIAALPAAQADKTLNELAVTATLNCLVGCLAGEATGMVIGTALGWSNLATLILAIGLAFVFGYTLTSIPLARAGMAVAVIVPIALAAGTPRSIAIMEAIDNGFVLAVPGAMDAGLNEASVRDAARRVRAGVRSRFPGQPRQHPARQGSLPRAGGWRMDARQPRRRADRLGQRARARTPARATGACLSGERSGEQVAN